MHFRHKSFLRQVQENRQIIIKREEGSKEENRQKQAECIRRFKTTSSKLGGFLSGQIVANTELQNKQDLRTVCRSLLFVQPTLCFMAKRIAIKAPKVGQVFPNATCNSYSFVIVFVD